MLRYQHETMHVCGHLVCEYLTPCDAARTYVFREPTRRKLSSFVSTLHVRESCTGDDGFFFPRLKEVVVHSLRSMRAFDWCAANTIEKLVVKYTCRDKSKLLRLARRHEESLMYVSFESFSMYESIVYERDMDLVFGSVVNVWAPPI